MNELGERGESLGIPLLFHPKKQIAQKRANNQKAVYVAQMDLRVDLAEVWDNLDKSKSEKTFIKMILPAGTEQECAEYLAGKGITREFLFPE